LKICKNTEIKLTRLECSGFVVPHSEVPDMGVTTKTLDRYIWPSAANSTEDSFEGAAGNIETNGVVAGENKHVDGLLVVDCILEPRLLDHVGCFDDLRDIAIASEIEENSKCHDAEAFTCVRC
jgi:hypothetical protein